MVLWHLHVFTSQGMIYNLWLGNGSVVPACFVFSFAGNNLQSFSVVPACFTAQGMIYNLWLGNGSVVPACFYFAGNDLQSLSWQWFCGTCMFYCAGNDLQSLVWLWFCGTCMLFTSQGMIYNLWLSMGLSGLVFLRRVGGVLR